jgi:endonuclease/exonuclease/phosphatase (EEP) superfamily protein YafD
MAREWQAEGTHIVMIPEWGTASDHRPIVARFTASDR